MNDEVPRRSFHNSVLLEAEEIATLLGNEVPEIPQSLVCRVLLEFE